MLRATHTVVIGGALVTLGAPLMRTFTIVSFHGVVIHPYVPLDYEPVWYSPFLQPLPEPIAIGPDCDFCPPPVIAFDTPVAAYTDADELLGDMVLASAVQEGIAMLAATAAPSPADPELDGLASDVASLQEQVAAAAETNDDLRDQIGQQQTRLEDLQNEMTPRPRPAGAESQMRVPEDIRRQVRNQVKECVEIHKSGKSLSLPDVIASAEAKKYVFQVGELIQATDTDNGEICALTTGDLVSFAEVPGESDQSAKIKVVASKAGSCPTGRTVSASFPDLQEMLNGFSERLEASMKKAHERVAVAPQQPVPQQAVKERTEIAAVGPTFEPGIAGSPAARPATTTRQASGSVSAAAVTDEPTTSDHPASDDGVPKASSAQPVQNEAPKPAALATTSSPPEGSPPKREVAQADTSTPGSAATKTAPQGPKAPEDPDRGRAQGDAAQLAVPSAATPAPEQAAETSPKGEAAKAEPTHASAKDESATSTAPPEKAAAAPIKGRVIGVVDAGTLVIGEQQIRLEGIDPGSVEMLSEFASWIDSRSPVTCSEGKAGLYRCLGNNGVDIGEAAILNGIARANTDASELYKQREAEARKARRGLWKSK
ncbi:MAG TPA: hypothetical protein VGG57_12685 [Stellaceae bacterium]|jgi:endonuclease YncB( thermonuclease family)